MSSGGLAMSFGIWWFLLNAGRRVTVPTDADTIVLAAVQDAAVVEVAQEVTDGIEVLTGPPENFDILLPTDPLVLFTAPDTVTVAVDQELVDGTVILVDNPNG